ncbi:MAG: phosphate/phosphite/phosphonate ABC transporter substrate-binding protein [Clostridium sp.]
MKKNKIIKLAMGLLLGTTMTFGLFGCSSSSSESDTAKNSNSKENSTITMVWYPNESGGDLEDARNEVGKVVEKATGKKVEHKLTTDYSVAIESIANGTAGICFMGPQGYVEAHTKNEKVLPLVVNSGASGTLDDAKYYSWLAVTKENADQYKKDGSYEIDNIEGKKMSFVSNSSTSGFKVPTSSIVSYFSSKDKWKNLTADDLMEGGSDKFFSEVMYGGSHQGSAVNLLTGKSDVAAFCDTVLVNYVDAEDGEFNGVGTTYKVKDDATEPFNTLKGKEFVAIASTPVLNSPFVVNTEVISDEDKKKIIEAFTSDEVTNNTKIFVPKSDENTKGFFKKEADEKFLAVDDKWFDPIRELSK